MKRFLTIACVSLLLLAIPAKDLTGLVWNCWYLINKEYVARELCVNKAKPQLHCNGKCHLAKQLKKLETPDNNTKKPTDIPLKPLEVNWITQQPVFSVVLYSSFCVESHPYWFIDNRAPQSVSCDVFHPPCLFPFTGCV